MMTARRIACIATTCLLFQASIASPSHASTAYGSLNNFDVVNDTGEECHGFEIELEDVRCSDITHTYNWNHYGTAVITENLDDAAHPMVRILWASGKNPDGSWTAYTAIPDGPIAPTDGHRFTNPNINFGGEHFGVGYRKVPAAVRYHWIVDDGAGNLIQGPAVQVSTPVFSYIPAAPNAPAQIVAAIEPPEPPEIPVKEFGEPLWIKEIKTVSHNNQQIELRDLVTDDPDDDDDKNWRNGEPDEVEVEWQLMQTEFNQDDGGANGRLEAEPQELPEGDEVVTRRYEFFAYVGPLDEESGEAKADKVGPDGIHGVIKTNETGAVVDYSNVAIVGDYLGAQMAAVQVDAGVSLVEHIQDGVVGEPFPPRTMVISGVTPFTAEIEGSLPPGLSFDPVEGFIDGTPSATGVYTFTISASDSTVTNISREYFMRIAGSGEVLKPAFTLEAKTYPALAGEVEGAGLYEFNQSVTLTATASPGFEFDNWVEQNKVISSDPTANVTMQVNKVISANFKLAQARTSMVADTNGVRYLSWPSEQVSPGWAMQSSSNLVDWLGATNAIADDGLHKKVPVADDQPILFYRVIHE